jgi:hypothetical protein
VALPERLVLKGRKEVRRIPLIEGRATFFLSFVQWHLVTSNSMWWWGARPRPGTRGDAVRHIATSALPLYLVHRFAAQSNRLAHSRTSVTHVEKFDGRLDSDKPTEQQNQTRVERRE